MKIPFSKYTANGNDFILIERSHLQHYDDYLHNLAIKVCERRLHIGADGLLILHRSDEKDFSLEIYNSDGSKADMCGNGSRCALFHFAQNKNPNNFNIDVWGNPYFGTVNHEMVSIQFERPSTPKPFEISQFGTTYLAFPNVRHLVVPVDDVNHINFEKEAVRLRNHKIFGNEGTNVDFIEIVDNQAIRARVFERGVESETLCCTSGSVAIGCTLVDVFNFKNKMRVEFPGGDLDMEITENSVIVSGIITEIYTGEFNAK